MPRLEHIGIAVRDAEAVRSLYRRILDILPYKEETVTSEGVRTHFLDAGSTKLELLEALGPDSPVAKYLEKRGEGLHHLAFEVDDIDLAWQRVIEAGFDPLGKAPRSGADDKRIFFLHPKQTHGVLVEFCQGTDAPLPFTTFPYRADTLAVFERGDAGRPLLLLLHGAAGSTDLELAPLARRLEATFRVLALDFGGHGRSGDLADTPFSVPEYAAQALTALDHAGAERAHVLGFSMGGFVALYLARHAPHRVDRLAVHGTCVEWDDVLIERMLERVDPASVTDTPARRAVLEAAHGSERWRTVLERTRRFVTSGFQEALPPGDVEGIAAPTLVTAVDRDDLFPLDRTLSLRDRLPDARLALLPGSRHAFRTLDPNLYAALLTHHLAHP